MVTVLGSLNIDHIAAVRRLPGPGETVPANQVLQRFGGKGANQAIAAARQGARVNMIGCVGNDSDGRDYRARLRREGIVTEGIFVSKNRRTGSAIVTLDRHGENIIVVAAGANGELNPSMVRAQRKRIVASNFLLVQMEVCLPAVIEAARIANRAGVGVLLNPSPVHDGFPWGKVKLDTVIVNESEARAIFGTRQISERRLAKARVETLIVTRGSRSTIVFDWCGKIEIPTAEIRPVDTVGAGDAFAGTYVARRAEGRSVALSVCYANCAGALATLKLGAQESIPTRLDVEKIMGR